MSAVRQLVDRLIDAGVSPADAAEIIALAMIAGADNAAPHRSSAAIRQERYRRNKASQSVTKRNEASQVTGCDDKKGPPLSPPSLSPTPPNSSPPIIPPKKVTSARAEVFERFWQAYPRKKEKRGAEAKFNSLVKSGIDPEAIIQGAQRLAISKPELKYTKHPTTWLNNGCWDDELIDRSDGKNERNNPLMDALDRIDRRIAEQRASEANRFDFGDDENIIELRPAASF